MYFPRVLTPAQIQSILAPQYFIPQYYNPQLPHMANMTQHYLGVADKLFNPITGQQILDTLLARADKISG